MTRQFEYFQSGAIIIELHYDTVYNNQCDIYAQRRFDRRGDPTSLIRVVYI